METKGGESRKIEGERPTATCSFARGYAVRIGR